MLSEMVASVFRKKKMKAKLSYTDIGSFATWNIWRHIVKQRWNNKIKSSFIFLLFSLVHPERLK
jgi:hypothetical protein